MTRFIRPIVCCVTAYELRVKGFDVVARPYEYKSQFSTKGNLEYSSLVWRRPGGHPPVMTGQGLDRKAILEIVI